MIEIEPLGKTNDPQDIRWLKQAVRVAEGNPDGDKKVGAVLVKDGMVIGVGYRKTIAPYGQYVDRTFHAEAMAIECAVVDPAGATLYTTMEPCECRKENPLWFVDPHCVGQIIKANIGRVVFLVEDPVVGGSQELMAAGIKVDCCPSLLSAE